MEKVCYKDVAILKYSNPDCEVCDNFRFLCAIDNSKQNFLDLETNQKVTLNEIYQNPEYKYRSVSFGIWRSGGYEIIDEYAFYTNQSFFAILSAVSKYNRFVRFARQFEEGRKNIVPVKKLLKWQRCLNLCTEKYVEIKSKEESKKKKQEDEVRKIYCDFSQPVLEEKPFVEDKIESPVIEEKINYEKEMDAVYEQAQKNVEEIIR
ncbi:MAG: hypothetical protein IJA69_01940 [Clostridia bacterium]|nr:hypothetical protein [Clostridia bacterium]